MAAKHISQVYKPCYRFQPTLYSFDPRNLTSQLHMCVYYISTSLCSETFVTHSGKYGSVQVNTIYYQGPIMPIPFDR